MALVYWLIDQPTIDRERTDVKTATSTKRAADGDDDAHHHACEGRRGRNDDARPETSRAPGELEV